MKALEFWNLPLPVQVAARDHHVAFEPVPPANGKRKTVSLAHVIACADQYVHCAGISVLDENELTVQHPLAIEGLSLSPEKLEAVLTNFKTEHEHMAQFFR